MAAIEARTIGDVTFLKGDDVCAALRERAGEYVAQADALGEDLDSEQYINCVAYRAVARELEARADVVAFATIAHLDEYPGDSPSD